MFCMMLLILFSTNANAAVQYDKLFLENDQGLQAATMPKSYLLKKNQSIFGEDALTLSLASDLFVAPNQRVYVADTGNHRVLELTTDLELVRILDNRDEKGFKRPEGVFVDDFGGIYVADTGNARVVKLDKEGRFVEEFTKPNSSLLTDSFVFNPRKVAVSNVGYLYALKFQYVMQMDAYNDFRGYIGTAEVGFDLGYTIKYLLSNAEQRKTMSKREPASCYSFDIGKDGSIYVVTTDRGSGELKCINSVGENIYPKKTPFGMQVQNTSGVMVDPQYTDVAVDLTDNVYMLESVSGEISVYSSQGDNLCVMGGKGNGQDRFETPVALDVDDERNIYVLDQKQGSIKKFAPTRFMNQVYNALAYYDAGAYEESERYWQMILDGHESYALASQGKARLKYKQKDYAAALDYFRAADERDEYSKVFTKWEMAYFREHFLPVVLVAAAAFVLLVLIVIGFRKYVRRKMGRYSNLV